MVSEAVGATMGPRGKLVIYNDPHRVWPVATKDGVSVAQRIRVPKGKRQLGADMCIQAANRQLRTVGDGTTLTCVLADAFAEFISKNGDIPQEVIDAVIFRIKLNSKQITSEHELIKAATVSANNDTELGNLVGAAVWKTGKNGVVMASREFGGGTRVEYQKGYNFNSAIKFAEFIDSKTGTFEFNSAYVIVTDTELSWQRQLVTGIQKVVDHDSYKENPRPIIIFCPVIKDDALAVIVRNFVDKKIMLVPISPEGTPNGFESNSCLLDIAAMSGATMISSTAGMRFEDLKFSQLGRIDKITSKPGLPGSTVLLNESSDVTKRIEDLEQIIANQPESFESEIARRSIARLTGSVATVHVGGENDTEINERMDRVDDAIRATKCALNGGIVDGGGVAILNAISQRSSIAPIAPDLFEVFLAPIKWIFKNAGLKPKRFLNQIHSKRMSFGYDINSGEIVDKSMLAMGICDPTDVVISAIKNALSVARTVTSCAVAITNIEDEVDEDEI